MTAAGQRRAEGRGVDWAGEGAGKYTRGSKRRFRRPDPQLDRHAVLPSCCAPSSPCPRRRSSRTRSPARAACKTVQVQYTPGSMRRGAQHNTRPGSGQNACRAPGRGTGPGRPPPRDEHNATGNTHPTQCTAQCTTGSCGDSMGRTTNACFGAGTVGCQHRRLPAQAAQATGNAAPL